MPHQRYSCRTRDPVFDKLNAVLAHALMSIGAVKAVEVGDGIAVTSLKGSTDNDGFTVKDGEIVKTSNHTGGIMGVSATEAKSFSVFTLNQLRPSASHSRLSPKTKSHFPWNPRPPRSRYCSKSRCCRRSMAAITLADALFANMSSQMDKVRDFYL